MVLSLIIFELNIAAEHVNAKRMTTIVRFHNELKQTVLNSWCVNAMGVRRGETGIFPFPGNCD